MEEQEVSTVYKVVRNQEEQYSICRAGQENAFGCRDAGNPVQNRMTGIGQRTLDRHATT
jgi:hypothetical protein